MARKLTIQESAERLAQEEARHQKLLARERELEDKRETRRKILTGAVVRNHMRRDSVLNAQILKWLEAEIKRPNDRKLFGLEPLPEEGEMPPPAMGQAIGRNSTSH